MYMRLLMLSVRLFKKAARILEYEKLKEICVDYQQLKYAKGVFIDMYRMSWC